MASLGYERGATMNCPFSVIMVPLLCPCQVQYYDNWRLAVPSQDTPLHQVAALKKTSWWDFDFSTDWSWVLPKLFFILSTLWSRMVWFILCFTCWCCSLSNGSSMSLSPVSNLKVELQRVCESPVFKMVLHLWVSKTELHVSQIGWMYWFSAFECSLSTRLQLGISENWNHTANELHLPPLSFQNWVPQAHTRFLPDYVQDWRSEDVRGWEERRRQSSDDLRRSWLQ